MRFLGRRGGREGKCNICVLVCPPLAGSLGAGKTRWSSRELGVRGGQLLCRQGKLRHGKGGDCLRLEKEAGWVPALRRVPKALVGRQGGRGWAHNGRAMTSPGHWGGHSDQ